MKADQTRVGRGISNEWSLVVIGQGHSPNGILRARTVPNRSGTKGQCARISRKAGKSCSSLKTPLEYRQLAPFQGSSGLDNLVPDGVADQLADRREIQLVHEVGPVGFYRLNADIQGGRDFFVTLSLCH